MIDTSFNNIGITPKVVRELETVDALLAFALEGEGVTILAYSNVYQQVERAEIAIREIKNPAINRQICLIFNQDVDQLTMLKIRKIIGQTMTEICSTCRWTML